MSKTFKFDNTVEAGVLKSTSNTLLYSTVEQDANTFDAPILLKGSETTGTSHIFSNSNFTFNDGTLTVPDVNTSKITSLDKITMTAPNGIDLNSPNSTISSMVKNFNVASYGGDIGLTANSTDGDIYITSSSGALSLSSYYGMALRPAEGGFVSSIYMNYDTPITITNTNDTNASRNYVSLYSKKIDISNYNSSSQQHTLTATGESIVMQCNQTAAYAEYGPYYASIGQPATGNISLYAGGSATFMDEEGNTTYIDPQYGAYTTSYTSAISPTQSAPSRLYWSLSTSRFPQMYTDNVQNKKPTSLFFKLSIMRPGASVYTTFYATAIIPRTPTTSGSTYTHLPAICIFDDNTKYFFLCVRWSETSNQIDIRLINPDSSNKYQFNTTSSNHTCTLYF